MGPSDMQQFIVEQDSVAGPERTAAEALAAEKHKPYLLKARLKYDRDQEKVLSKSKAKYAPTGRSVGRPRLPRE